MMRPFVEPLTFSLVSAFLLYFLILQPMQEDAVIMENHDPSEILALRLPVERVSLFVVCDFLNTIGAIFWRMWHSGSISLLYFLRSFTEWVLFWLVGLFLCGDFVSPSKSSIATSFLCAVSLATKITCFHCPPLQYIKKSEICAQSALIGALLSILLIPLDAGFQIQRFPAPLVVGSSLGRLLGILFVSLKISVKKK